MKSKLNYPRNLRVALMGLTLAGTLGLVHAVPDRVLNTFDTDISGCGNAWGAMTGTFDPTQDATGNGGGSLYITSDFAADQNTLTYFINEPPNGAWWFPGPPWNMTDYISVEFDIKWDNSKTLSIADFNTPPLGGENNIAIWATDYPNFSIRPTIGFVPVPAAAASGWAHVSLPINPATAGIDPSVGIVLKKWISSEQRDAGGTYGFWIDNVVLKGADAPPPPPSVGLEKAIPGLALVAATGGQWDRQNIRTVSSNYTWIGRSGPVSYSVDIARHTDIAGMQLHMYLIPGVANPDRWDSDWHEANILMWRIIKNADGSAWSPLNFKTNAPDNNGRMYNSINDPDAPGGDMGGVWASTPVGEWTLTFTSDTAVTITGPDGASGNFEIPAEVIAIFSQSPYMQIAVGIVPGAIERIGQKVMVNRVRITGTAEPNVDSSFVDQPLNPVIWEIKANSPTLGVQLIPSSAPWWMSWTLPASGFGPQVGDKASGGTWTVPSSPGYAAGGRHYVLLNSTDVPEGNTAFFRLLKRVGTKLLVLLPGEEFAPGTPTGKTGTPDRQTSSVAFNATVRLVDDDNYPVTAPNDTVRISVEPAVAGTGFGEGADGLLINGVATISVTCSPFSDDVVFVITAENLDNPEIQSATATVTVGF